LYEDIVVLFFLDLGLLFKNKKRLLSQWTVALGESGLNGVCVMILVKNVQSFVLLAPIVIRQATLLHLRLLLDPRLPESRFQEEKLPQKIGRPSLPHWLAAIRF